MKTKHKKTGFRQMVESSPIALIQIDVQGKVVFVNSYVETLFCYNKGELLGQNILLLLPERFHSKLSLFLQTFQNNVEKLEEKSKIALFAVTKNGEEFPVEVILSPLVYNNNSLVLATFINITERGKANEQFRLVVESAPNAIILVDSLGEIVMINKQAETLFGYHRKELIGQKMEILVPTRIKDHHPKLRRSFYTNAKARPMGAGRDLFGLKKDGNEVPIEIGLNPLEKDGETFVLASIIDITERKKSEDAIRLYNKRLEDKNKELEQFTYIASHDLREPLNSINSLIELFIENEGHKLGAEGLKQLEFITKSSTRMKELVKGLLDYARLGKKSEFKPIDFNEVVELAINDLEISVKDSEARFSIEKLPVLEAMEMEIRLLFQNLISNAIKYQAADHAPEINISAKKVKGGWNFAVSDNGIGIPADQKEKIFIIFQRLHGRNEYDGIGIGLSHCRKIVELHDGKIWVDSELNNGSTFYFFIPVNR